MGYMRHHAIVVTSWDDDSMDVAHAKAHELFDPVDARMVGRVSDAVVNGYRSFLVGPDGSKESWETSDSGDAARDAFTEWLEAAYQAHVWLDWAEVQYGDEDGFDRLVRSSADRGRQMTEDTFRVQLGEATGYADGPLTALMHAAADRMVPMARQLRENGWTVRVVARRDPDTGRITMAVECELRKDAR